MSQAIDANPAINTEATEKKARRPRKPKADWPGLTRDDAGDVVRLKEAPADFNVRKHAPLTKRNFEDEAVFFDFKAGCLEQQAAGMRQQAEECRKLGNKEDRAKARKLKSWLEKAADLRAELMAGGIDVDSLLDPED